MKRLLKKIFRKIFDPIAFKLGYTKNKLPNNNLEVINVYNKNNLLHSFYSVLKSVDFIPTHIVDVGANHGDWTRAALIEFPDCRFTLLEPQSQLKELVKDLLESNSNVSFHAVGVGKESGTFNFTIVDQDHSCTFIFSAEEAKERNFEQIPVQIVTLNEFIPEQNLPIPDIIKIDAEGLDLDVLEGASNMFGKTEIFLVEAGIVNKIFHNSFLNVINFMDRNGYNLFDITDINKPYNPPVLWLTELVFVKKNGLVDSHKWI